MSDFDKLKQRVEAMRKLGKWGRCEVYRRGGAWYISITGYHREIHNGDLDLWNGYLDGLAALDLDRLIGRLKTIAGQCVDGDHDDKQRDDIVRLCIDEVDKHFGRME